LSKAIDAMGLTVGGAITKGQENTKNILMAMIIGEAQENADAQKRTQMIGGAIDRGFQFVKIGTIGIAGWFFYKRFLK